MARLQYGSGQAVRPSARCISRTQRRLPAWPIRRVVRRFRPIEGRAGRWRRTEWLRFGLRVEPGDRRARCRGIVRRSGRGRRWPGSVLPA
ncbi:MAG: hypothetical protein D6725_11565 [Planctomycetota bacterium]|nr:MAG: hypothetical protein D6725_11565 [Planctomycetota bacterium]